MESDSISMELSIRKLEQPGVSVFSYSQRMMTAVDMQSVDRLKRGKLTSFCKTGCTADEGRHQSQLCVVIYDSGINSSPSFAAHSLMKGSCHLRLADGVRWDERRSK